jgi:hypothetical protein
LLKTKIQYRHSVFMRASGWWAATCYDQCSYWSLSIPLLLFLFFYLKNKQIFPLPFSCDISGPLFSSSVSENI